MKKISLLLAVIMLFSVFSVGVCADDLPTINAETTRTENNTVELLLSISENSNIAGCSFNIVYDSNKLTYSSHEVGSVISSMMNLVNPEYNSNAIRVLWADMKELTAGGDVIKIVFVINEGATGSTDIIIDKLIMMDISSNPVDCSCENPTIQLTDGDAEDEEIENAPTEGDEINTPDDSENESSNSSNNTSGNNNSGHSSSNNRPSSSTTSPGESESTKEPINNETKEPVIEDTEDITDDEDEVVSDEEDYEVFLLSFNDVKETDWFFESVRFANFYHLMSGVSENEFAPLDNLTRGMLVTILYRLEGEPECSESTFNDVEKDMWYSDGIAWAAENKVVNGIGENKFAPNSNITREQIALIMYNYSNLHSLDTTESKSVESFKDASDVSEWSKKAIEWAVGSGLLSGKGDGILDPKGNATRAEIATILMRYVERYDENEI